MLRDYGLRARPDVVASFGLHRHAWPTCLLITVPRFAHRRVPRPPVGHVSYDRTVPGLSIGRTAVQPAGFACLPGDPAAAPPCGRVVDGEEALRGRCGLRRPSISNPSSPGSGRAYGGAGGPCGAMGPLPLLEALLPGTAKPYARSAAFRELDDPDGAPLPTRDRVSRCMFHTVRPEDTCATCPRTCDADRAGKPSAAAAS